MKGKQLLLVIILLMPALSQAQYLSRLERFQVVEKKGCASLSVTISNTNLMPPIICGTCDITWGDGTPQEQISTNTASHLYSQPGTYTLSILYQNAGPDDIQIVVTPNTQPVFNLITCGGDEVRVQIPDTNYDSYIINYNDGSPEVQVPKGIMAVDNHPFASSGNKTITVRGKDVNASDNCSSGSKNVLAMATLPAPFINELEVKSNNQIDFVLTTLSNIQYRLEIATNNNTNFQVAQTVYNSTTASLTNLRTDINYYCFRLGAFDPCNNTIAYSNILCSSNFTAAAQNNMNNLNWVTNPTGVNGFSILRNNAVLTNPSAGTNSYVDNATICKTDYCYQLITTYVNSSRSISNLKCVTAFSSDIPTPINNATAVVTSTGLDISWQQDPAFTPIEYEVFRKEGSTSFQLFAKTPTTSYTDLDYTTEGEFCYQVNYTEVCGNSSPRGIEICPIRLGGNLTAENHSQLDWTSYSGWQNDVSQYSIEKYTELGVLLQTIPVGPTVNQFIDSDINPGVQVYRYIIKADANQVGLGQAVSNEIIIVKEPKIIYPTAFTPDKQGPVENEIFKVFGLYIAKFEMHIFNRWGELIYSTTDIDSGWDGTYKGAEVPDGNYAFVARLKDLTGNSFTRSGSIVLLRKR